MKRIKTLAFGLMALACSFAGRAEAQSTPSFELEQLDFNPAGNGGLLVGGSDVLPVGEWRVSALAHYQKNPLRYFPGSEDTAEPVRHRVTGMLAAAYTFLPWLELNAQLPIVLYQSGGPALTGTGGIAPFPIEDGRGFGTPWVGARLALMREDAGAPLDFGLGFSAGIPIGRRSDLTKEVSWVGRPRVGAGKSFGNKVRVAAELAAFIRRNTFNLPAGLGAETGAELGKRWETGVGVSTLGEGVRGELSLRSYLPTTDLPVGHELMAGIRIPVYDFELFALGGPGFGDTVGTPDYRFMLGVALGADKKCRSSKGHDPSDCPDLDFDGDGVANGRDQCPRDGGQAAYQGCPPPDTDGDGVTDDVDVCPSEAGPKDRKGCPAPDADKDGVEDANDECPREAGPEERKGCPVPPDADGDGIADKDDKCPNEKGVAEQQGCPPPPPAPKRVEIKEDRIEIREVIYFNPGKATLQERSFGLLHEIADVLIKNPQIKRVSVDGHTDDRGSDAVNQRLSERRAKAVADFLASNGVERARLVPRGFGESRPIEPNDTPEGRERNRRVEFLILEGPGVKK